MYYLVIFQIRPLSFVLKKSPQRDLYATKLIRDGRWQRGNMKNRISQETTYTNGYTSTDHRQTASTKRVF